MITLGSTVVGPGTEPYLIAEIGVNHGGSMDLARQLIRSAHAGGCDAAKFQTYKAAKLASRHSPAYWDTTKETIKSQFELFSRYDQFNEADYRELAGYCREVGIDFVSTPFDDDAVEFLADLVPYFKIASADLTNTPFLRRVAAKGKPVVLSTGASTLAEIDEALDELRRHGSGDIALLHCVLNYPTTNRDAHLAMIRGLAHAYPSVTVGYSDHTMPDPFMTTLTTAYLLGARVLEKHFTHDKGLPGNDHYHAMDEADAKCFSQRIAALRELMGESDHKGPIAGEEAARQFARRSLVTTRPIRAGSVLDESSLTYKRPGTGISPRFWDEIIGLRATRDLDEDHLLMWADVAK